MIRQVKIDCDRQVVLENRGYGPITVRNSDTTATGKCGNTDEPVVIVWDGLNEEERECNALDVNGKTLGTVETTRLLVDNKEE